MIHKIEALADAISNYNGYKEPTHSLYQTRNPGALRAFSNRYPQTQDGFRWFTKAVDGYQAFTHDLEKKCSGTSYCGLKKESPLLELLRVYGMRDESARYIVKFLNKAFGEENLVSEETPVSFFMEK